MALYELDGKKYSTISAYYHALAQKKYTKQKIMTTYEIKNITVPPPQPTSIGNWDLEPGQLYKYYGTTLKAAAKKAEPTPLTITVGQDPEPLDLPTPIPVVKKVDERKVLREDLASFIVYCRNEGEEVPELIQRAFDMLSSGNEDTEYNIAWQQGYDAGHADAKYSEPGN